MLGFAPLAAAPLGAAGTAGTAYDITFGDAAVVADTALQAFATFPTSITVAGTASEITRVAASTFNANMSGAAAGSVAAAAVAAFLSNLSGAATGTDAASALAIFASDLTDAAVGVGSSQAAGSTYNATAFDAATGDDSARALATMFASFAGSATITDSDIANFLWNVINDSQTVTWGAVNTSQSASSWGTIGTGQSSDWTPVKTQA